MSLPVARIRRALAAPGIYAELVVASGWTDDAYEGWLYDQLTHQLLA